MGEIADTLATGDQYRVHNFSDALFVYVRSKLNVSNCCLVYSQLLAVSHATAGLRLQAQVLIERHSKQAFESASFSRIDEVALKRILMLNLSAEEIDKLRGCSVWVDAKAKRLGLPTNKENRLKLFDPIKRFIRLDAIPVAEIARSEELQNLLSERDIVHLLLRHFSTSQQMVIQPAVIQPAVIQPAVIQSAVSQPAASQTPEQPTQSPVNEELSIQIDSDLPNSKPPNSQPTNWGNKLVGNCSKPCLLLVLLFLLLLMLSISMGWHYSSAALFVVLFTLFSLLLAPCYVIISILNEK